MESSAPGSLLWITVLVLAPLTIAGFFFVLLNFFGWVSGWKKLAAAYPPTGDPVGAHLAWTSARVGGLSYNNCINAVAGRDKLHLSMSFLLRFGHPPICLPWREVRIAPLKGWFAHYLVFTTVKEPGVEIRFWRPVAEDILRAAGHAVPDPLPRRS